MLQLRSKVTGKIIEVNEIDAHWYQGHEEYENAEAPKAVEAKPEEKAETEVKKRGRPRKVH